MQKDLLNILSPSNVQSVKLIDCSGEATRDSIAAMRSRVLEFIHELDECLDHTDSIVNEMRIRREMSEILYMEEHSQCLTSLDCLKSVTEVAEEARKRACMEQYTQKRIGKDFAALVISVLVPPLRRASLLWDDLHAFLLQAESQLRRVKLRVGRKRSRPIIEGAQANLTYSFDTMRNIEKPSRLHEIDEALRRTPRTFGVGKRTRIDNLAELTNVSCRVLDKNIRRWQAAILPLSGIESDSNRWTQRRLRGWWSSDSGAIKIWELNDGRIDRYVSVLSCGEDQDVPETANVVVASVDIGCDTHEVETSLKILEDAMQLAKKRAAPLNLVIPVVVLVAFQKHQSDLAFFNLEANKLRERLLKEGSASMLKVVNPSDRAIRKDELDKTMNDALIASVDLVSHWECSEELTVEAITLREVMLSRAAVAWKDILVYSRSFDDLNEKNMKVIEAINQSWRDLAKDMLLQECRWPVEVTRRREEMKKLRKLVEKHGRLLLPQRLQVKNTSEYIAILAAEAGVETSNIDYTERTHLLWQFCLALQTLLPSLLKVRMGNAFDETLLLPRERWTPESFKRKQDIEMRYLRSDRTRVGVLLPPKRPTLKRELVHATSRDEGVEQPEKRRRLGSNPGWYERGSDALGASTGTIMAPDVNALGWNRVIAPSVREALIQEGEEYSKLLDATMLEIQERSASRDVRAAGKGASFNEFRIKSK